MLNPALRPSEVPPAPGSIWCNSCDSWFNVITNTCRCNNR
ncbi:hypothetical protein J2Z21_008378 [Streptomyces griseochromogenes]|uniref:Uncharacterized protein n=1 Tax=Streptomyces griseochromogenes TaxID=68214 RepID=A0ABS4M6R5_9ACTN|nr:hypothetical protein [Streptomyces griseochromogenes]